MLSQGRAFATITLPFQGVRNVCAIATIQKQPRVVVASTDGYLYIYNLNTAEGGDCTLLKQHRLDGSGESCTPSSEGSTGSGPYPGGAKKTEPVNSTGSSYAGVVRGPSAGVMTGSTSADALPSCSQDSDKLSEMAAACESPPKSVLKFDDDSEFPPV
ncbi:WD repeat domain phosphoinositide-interacting protein 2 [Halocaridina rubra]|uniref:WD repeat domain phosphoinositide-interacting protein 2 n=1 Tax=Halocaridina rubra TaxID=373956 RepID=A0AAN8X063_HALRR